MKQVWNPESHQLTTFGSGQLSSAGIRSFWQAVDRTIRFADCKFKTGQYRCTSINWNGAPTQSGSNINSNYFKTFKNLVPQEEFTNFLFAYFIWGSNAQEPLDNYIYNFYISIYCSAVSQLSGKKLLSRC